MKKKSLLIAFCALLCASSFAAEGHRCGLRAENISIEGSMINNYSALLRFTLTNPTDTVAYTDYILLYDEVTFDGNKGYLYISYIFPGERPLPVSLRPGETKDMELLIYNINSPYGRYKVCISGDYEEDGFIDELGRIETDVETTWRPLDITGAIELDNVSGNGKRLDFYGSDQTGRVTLTNGERNVFLAYDRSDQYIRLQLHEDDGTGKYTMIKSVPLAERLEPDETIVADFSMEGELEDGKDYMLVVEYGTMQYTGTYATATDTVFFTAHNTPAYWKEDGSAVAFTTDEGAAFKVPTDAAAVNLSRMGENRTLDLSEASPNCLYYLPEGADVPEGLDGRNVVIGGKAETVNLSDGHGFHCPAHFTADNAFYTRKQGVENIDGGGWEPLALPFDADNAELLDINGLHTGGNVTVKELAATNGDVLEFREVGTEGLKAEAPYIIKVETPASGVVFHGADKVFAPHVPEAQAGKYRFVGSFRSGNAGGAYVINSNGTAFEFKADAITVPFRGFFVTEDGTTEYDRLYIDRHNADGIRTVTANNGNADDSTYTTVGTRVANGTKLPKGIYVRNGKKVAIK